MRKKSWRNFLNGPDKTIKKKFSMKHTDFQPTISIVIFWRKSCWLRGCYIFFNKSNCSIINVQILRPCRKPFKSATEIEKQWMRTVISAKREQSQMSHLIASCDTFFQTRTALFCVNKAMSCQVIPPLYWLSCLVHFFSCRHTTIYGKMHHPKISRFYPHH